MGLPLSISERGDFMARMSGAEMRARLTHLGFTVDSLAYFTGWDLRGLKRQVSDVAPVSPRTQEFIETWEREALADLAQFDEATDAGVPIYIPRLNTLALPGQKPPRWWMAIAGRHIAARGDDAQIEWRDDDEPTPTP